MRTVGLRAAMGATLMLSATLAAIGCGGVTVLADTAGGSQADATSGPGTSNPATSSDGGGGPTSTGGSDATTLQTGNGDEAVTTDPATSVGHDGTTSGDASEATSSSSSDDVSSQDASSGSSEGSTGEVPLDPTLPHFTDVTDPAGVSYIQGEVHLAGSCLIDEIGPAQWGFCNPERVIAGAAVADVDGDGDQDLFVTRTGDTDLLFRNDGAAGFTDITEDAGLTIVAHSAGAAFGDVDNDGDQDLYVATIASYAHLLYINDGTGHFTSEGVARTAVVATTHIHIGMTPIFGDFDLDGWLDIFVGEWRTEAGIGDHPSHARLLRNRGAAQPGVFDDVTEQSGIRFDDAWIGSPALAGTYNFAPAFTDLDGDRYPELTAINDYGTSKVYWNMGDGTFVDRTDEIGAGLEGNGMGSTLGDYDNDGDLDWYVTSITNPEIPPDNRLYNNQGDGMLVDVGAVSGLGDNGWGWGATFFDVDNDGDLDLTAVAGYYFAIHTQEPMKLWRNEGLGQWSDLSEDVGFNAPRQRRLVASWDYDKDGDLDLIVTSNADAPELYRNDTIAQGDWLRIRLVGTTSNRDGIGARVFVRVEDDGTEQMREIGSDATFMGHGDRAAHFGLGDGLGPVSMVRVEWPASQIVQVIEDVDRNQELVVVEQ
jgi:hypothetical protein